MLNSCMGRFSAPSEEGPLLPKLRGYVAEFLNEVSLARLGASAHPPTCVGFGTVPRRIRRALFSALRHIGCGDPRIPFRAAVNPPHRGHPLSAPTAAALTRGIDSSGKRGNVDPLSIGYAFRPGLRHRLTPGGRTCPGKPWDSGDRDSHPVFRYSCPHNHRHALHGDSRPPLRRACRAPLPFPE